MAQRWLNFTDSTSYSHLTPRPLTLVWLSICTVTVVGAWRQYDTQVNHDSFQQRVWVEWLSWAIIFAATRLFQIDTSIRSEFTQNQRPWRIRAEVWLVGFNALLSQLTAGQEVFSWTLPLITMILTVVAWKYNSRAEREPSDKEEEIGFLSGILPSSFDNLSLKESLQLPAPMVLNLACVAIILSCVGLATDQSSLLQTLSFLLTRCAFIYGVSHMQQRQADSADEGVSGATASEVVAQLSTPMMSMLTLALVVIRPASSMTSFSALAHAIAQALSWVGLIVIARAQMINTAANLETISLSAQLAMTGIDFRSILTAICALLVSVTQSVVVLRLHVSAIRKVYFGVLVFVLLLWAVSDPRLTYSPTLSNAGHFFKGHPIENLITEKRLHFDRTHARQSKTLGEAMQEYQRRYRRRPPLGFDKWFELAQKNNFVLIDEFDTFMHSLEPFHGLHPSIVRQRMQDVLESDALGRMCVVEIENGKLSISEILQDVGEALINSTFAELVPYNVTVVLNAFDEPMVNAPWEEVHKAVNDARNPQSERYAKTVPTSHSIPFVETGQQSGWAATRDACSIHTPSRQTTCPEHALTDPLLFINNRTEHLDVCQNCELKSQHGMLLAPNNMHIAHELVPIWSASKPSHFNDILHPSHYYVNVRDEYRQDLDLHWDDKDSKIYWVGTATGGYVTEKNWEHMQRQRLVLSTNKQRNIPVQLLENSEAKPKTWIPRFSHIAELAELFITKISNVVQCEERACELQREAFGLTEDGTNSDPKEAAYMHKFVLDIDGNGFSGRYYRLLRSRSVVIKSTILKEWHDDRLIPWVHFVPLSVGYSELPEIARFMAGTSRGLELSERIARESTDWHNRALRDIDLRIVYLRMVLEFGRVLRPDLTL